MKVKYSEVSFTFRLLHLIKNNMGLELNLSYPFNKMEIKDSFFVVSDWETNTIEITGDKTLYNSTWDPLPLIIGGRLNYFLDDDICFYVGFNYHIQSYYKSNVIGSIDYYSNDGTELDWNGLSSNMLNINAGITLALIN